MRKIKSVKQQQQKQGFTQSTPAYDGVPSNLIWLQKDQQFSRYVETVIFDQMSPNCDPGLEDSKPISFHDTLAHDVASPYQVWLQKVQKLRRCQMNIHWNSEPFL